MLRQLSMFLTLLASLSCDSSLGLDPTVHKSRRFSSKTVSWILLIPFLRKLQMP
eukprot:jgi/Bigna1/60180/fgenesh1_kg.9_\